MSYISADQVDNEIFVWERDEEGKRRRHVFPVPYYFYIEDPNGQYTSLHGKKVKKLVFPNKFAFNKAILECVNEGIQTYEAGISPTIKLLSEKYYGCDTPRVNVSFYDIEVDYDPELGFADTEYPYAEINSLTMYHAWKDEYVVIAVPPDKNPIDIDDFTKKLNEIDKIAGNLRLLIVKDERELLLKFLDELEDVDLYCGWNSDTFDTPYIGKRVEHILGTTQFKRLEFKYGKTPRFRKFRPFRNSEIMVDTLDTSGRIKSDYLLLFKKYEMAERPSYKLESIADEILTDMPKLSYDGSLHDLYRKDFVFFVRYNIRDCEILAGLEQKLGYVALAIEMYKSSTGLYQNILGTIKLAEYSIINYCHHEMNVVVPDSKKYADNFLDRSGDSDSSENQGIQGAYVLLPRKGMHEWIGSIDVTSLYPSSIRSINISPETLIGQFEKNAHAFKAIHKGTDEELVFYYDRPENALQVIKDLTKEEQKTIKEGVGRVKEVRTAKEWRHLLKERAYAISGYGTVFTQERIGVIPTILSEWFATRKAHKKKLAEAEKTGNKQDASYYDRLQYVYKIKLNSLYGALTNQFFMFYDLRMGESTTGTGREILQHQCREVNRVLENKYEIEFPLYETVQEALEAGRTPESALHGPLFNGNFQTQAVIYGDTDSTYFNTFARNEDEAVLVADAVAKKVNASFPEFMRTAFLCTPGHDNLIITGREIVANRGIFVGKKLYIVRIVDKEGKKKVSLKTMGLQTKKTTLPKEVSKRLNKFIERLLEGEEWDTIAQDIVSYKEELEKSEVTKIGLPRGVQGVEKYTEAYNKDKTTRLPGHVAASIHYNICRANFKDVISMPIISGMKIKVYYLVGIHEERFKSVALPTDIEQVPVWFSNFTVDKAKHIERLVDKPLSTILEAIDKEVPTKQTLFEEELFIF